MPLHVEELVKALVQGHLSADPSYVPETLADAVGQRFGVLSTPARDVAVAAAVVGRSFDLELIASVVEQPDLVVADSVDELVERQFFQAEAGGWFGFRHALIRDAIGRTAPLATRRALHARVAELARRRPELGGDGYRSAHHEAAGQLAEASAAAAAAAERASALSAHHEALDLLHRAIRCLRDGDEARLVPLLVRRAAEAAATDHNAQAAADHERARAILLAPRRPGGGGRAAAVARRRPAPAGGPAADPAGTAGGGARPARRARRTRTTNRAGTRCGPHCWRPGPPRSWSTTASTRRSRRARRRSPRRGRRTSWCA